MPVSPGNKNNEIQVRRPLVQDEKETSQGLVTKTIPGRPEAWKLQETMENAKNDMVLIVGICETAISHRVHGKEQVQVVSMPGKAVSPVLEEGGTDSAGKHGGKEHGGYQRGAE